MATLDGVFLLRTPSALLGKLEHDFNRFKSADLFDLNADGVELEAYYAAFDFFVTAEHLAEWQALATGEPSARLRDYPDGAVVSHIANGAKHFTVTDKRHTSVKGTHLEIGREKPNDPDSVRALLGIEKEDGSVESALAIAERVLAHWKSVIK